MIPVIIDSTLCSGCALCVQVCPYKALAVQDGCACYLLESCFICGHCQAVCPEAAVNLPGLSQPVKTDLQKMGSAGANREVHATSFLVELMAGRRSCRNYKDSAVPLFVMEELVQIAITAPSGTNCQPWNFVLLPERGDLMVFGSLIGKYFKRLNRLAESRIVRFLTGLCTSGALNRYYENHYESVKEAIHDWDEKGEDRLFHGARAAILVTAKNSASCPAEDALLATQNILLAAHSMGLGSCLIGFAVEAVKRDKSIGRALGIAGDEKLYATIALGYPKISYARSAVRKKVSPRILRFDKGNET
jgi:nitroreductase/NAD-dependent dihydropyrimidine dehydrogenase PreA subunit